jgi:integral membrane protein (TIGR01906 family)
VGAGEDARGGVGGGHHGRDVLAGIPEDSGYDARVNRLAAVVVALATAIVIVTVVILPFLTPQWIGFEQSRAQAEAWTGYTTEQLRTATDAIVGDLVFGGDYAVTIDGQAVLEPRERSHMVDVRSVFRGLWILATISVVVLVVAARRADRAATWRAVRGGAIGLAIGTVVVGVVGLLAFDQLFETFHEIFFPAGSFLFDPRTDKLVQLFPFDFWQETALVVGAAIIVVSVAVAVLAGRRAARAGERTSAPELRAVTESRARA